MQRSGDRATSTCIESKVKFDGITVSSSAYESLNLDTEIRKVAAVRSVPSATPVKIVQHSYFPAHARGARGALKADVANCQTQAIS